MNQSVQLASICHHLNRDEAIFRHVQLKKLEPWEPWRLLGLLILGGKGLRPV
jgi:hypothetical protein